MTSGIEKWLADYPNAALGLVFLVAFLESTAIVGLVFPGVIVIGAIGLLVGAGVIDARLTILLAILGGFMGGLLSFQLGYLLKDDLYKRWPFSRFPGLLQQGQWFFQRHGGKSIFIARFLGPVRAIIPLVAGSLNMSHARFISIDLLASLIWAPAFLLPGVLLAYTGFSLNITNANMVYAAVSIAIFSLFSVWLYRIFNYYTKKLVTHLLANMDHIDNNQASAGIANGLFYWLMFAALAYLHYHNWFNQLNMQVMLFMEQLSKEIASPIVIFTLLGSPAVMISLYIVVLAYLLYKRQLWLATVWFAHGASTGGGVYLLKKLLAMPRPPGVIQQITSSFPSSHVALTTGLLLMFYQLTSSKQHNFLKPLLGIFITAMASTRLLLGAHWFIDVAAGLIWGVGSYLIFKSVIPHNLAISQQRQLLLLGIATICFSWLLLVPLQYTKELQLYGFA